MTTGVIAHAEWLNLVNRYVNSIRFGAIQIVIHEGKVVQVERTEKVRFDKAKVEEKEFLKSTVITEVKNKERAKLTGTTEISA